MTLYKKAENNQVVLSIMYDQSPESPREWDNLGTMICWHSRYNLGDKHNFSDPRNFMESLAGDLGLNWQQAEEATDAELYEYIKANAVILPVYMYEHGGVALSTGSFGDPWDSGQVGWIYATKDAFLTETGYTADQLFGDEQKAAKMLKIEVEIYNKYLNGDVFGYKLERKIKCECCESVELEHIDSCWGFYGSDFKMNGLLDEIPAEYRELVDRLEIAL